MHPAEGEEKMKQETIIAQGSYGAAGIGCGLKNTYSSSCGSIYISGGIITAEGGTYAPGIGCGYTSKTYIGYIYIGSSSTCGDITITKGVTSITARKGNSATYSIGKGELAISQCTQQCGTITIGGVDYGTDGITTDPFIYTP